MLQSSCDVCFLETFGPYDAAHWAVQNRWFHEYSSLAGALGSRKYQEASSPEPASELCANGHNFGVSYKYNSHGFSSFSDRRYDGYADLWTIVDLRGEVAHFCRIGRCPYWHTEPKQVKRHRDTHVGDRYGWLCPNQTGTCPSQGGNFRRRDAVNVHCSRSRVCGEILKANGGKIKHWGIPANEEDLVLYDPKIHIPYQIFYGWTGRR